MDWLERCFAFTAPTGVILLATSMVWLMKLL